MSESGETRKQGLVERGLRWDVKFQRCLGVAAVGVGAVVPAVAGYAAAFAAGNFVAAEVEKRAADGIENSKKKRASKKLGTKATKHNFVF